MLARYSPRRFLWLLVPLLALAYVGWVHWLRADRVSEVSQLDNWSVDAPRRDAKSPTGWESGRRNLILSLPSVEGREWIAQTQLMFSSGEWRIRHVGYDNAPVGRATLAASAYRWWLGGLAWCDNLFTDVPIGLAVERASLYANPLLQALLILGALPLIARRVGLLAAVLFGLGVACLYPFSECFVPGLPSSRGLALVFLIWTFLPLLFIGLRGVCGKAYPDRGDGFAARKDRYWFIVSGIAGALGLWVDAAILIPALGGLVLGAILAAILARRSGESSALLTPDGWRWWGLSLGSCCLILYFVDYYPGKGAERFEVLNPLHCLAVFGLGELLGYFLPWLAGRGRPSGPRAYGGLVAGILAISIVSVALAMKYSAELFEADFGNGRLSDLPGRVSVQNLGAWLSQSGVGSFWSSILPLLGLIAAVAVVWRRAPVARRMVVFFALGPLLVFAGLAWTHLSVFTQVDAAMLLMAVACAADARAELLSMRQWVALLGAFALIAPGAWLLIPDSYHKSVKDVTDFEQQEILARDLAHWLSSRIPDREGAVVAPPDIASLLSYYGGLRVVGSMASENREGFLGVVRIANASTLEEALALVQKRGVTQIVLPSWNHLLDDFISTGDEMGEGRHPPVDSFLYALRHWRLPPWLHPMAYPIPKFMREHGESLTVFSVVEDQDESLAQARLAEYFAENAMLERAGEIVEKLKQYPGDPGALAALAQVQMVLGDKAGFDASIAAIESLLPAILDLGLAWDRRLSIAVVLVVARHADQASGIFATCLAELDEAKLRSLSLTALTRLLTFAKLYNLEISDVRLKAAAVASLPPQLRSRF